MDDSLISGLMGHLQGQPLNQIAQSLGMDPATAQNAIESALPMIMGTMAHQAQQPGGAGELLQALQEDHSGQDSMSLGGLLGSLSGGGQGSSGLGGLLGSVMGALGGGGGQAQSGGGLGGILGSVMGALGGGDAQQQQPPSPQLDSGGILGHIFGDAQSHAQDGLGQTTGIGSAKAGQLMMMLAPIIMSYLSSHAQSNNLDAGGLSSALNSIQNSVQNQGGPMGGLLGSILGRL